MAARIVIGSLIAAVALGGAVWLHGHRDVRTVRTRVGQGTIVGTERRKPSWADPLALFIAVAGVGVGAAVIVGRRQRRESPSPRRY